MTDASRARDDGSRPVDQFGLWVEAKRSRRSLKGLRSLVSEAVGLVWSASPRRLVVTCLVQLGSAGLLAAQVLVGKVALDAILRADSATSSTSDVLPSLLALALVTALAGAMSTFGTEYLRLLTEDVNRRTWEDILDVTESVELTDFEDPDFFDHLHRVEIAAALRPLAVVQGLISLASGGAGVLALLVVLVRLQPLLALLLLLTAPPLWVISRRGGRMEFEFIRSQTPPTRQRFYLRDVLTDKADAKEVRSFRLAGALRERYDARYDAYQVALRSLVRSKIRLALAASATTSLVLAVTLATLVSLVLAGRLELSAAAAGAITIRLLAGRISALVRGSAQLFESALFLRDLAAFRERRRSRLRPDATSPGNVAPLQELGVDDVHFSYPGSAEEALAGVSMRIQRGEVVALVGENGSGKTTLAKVVATLFPPGAGRVCWNSTDMAELDQVGLRERIAVIFQDFSHFELGAAENIGFGRVARLSDSAAVVEAARRAGIDGVLEALPQGYATVLSKAYAGGRDLSGGQWQKVALARALFRDADLLILDEPTAALDPRAEHELFTRVRDVARGRTVLLISHRFSTVREADRIVVLQSGRVIETGTHDALMADQGLYAELYSLQAAAYRDG